MKQLTPTLLNTINRYAKLKRLEKKITDSLSIEREKILDYTGRQPEVLSFNNEKLASVILSHRENIDSTKLKLEKPEIAKEYSKLVESLQVRLH